jgi:hypothetical protein
MPRHDELVFCEEPCAVKHSPWLRKVRLDIDCDDMARNLRNAYGDSPAGPPSLRLPSDLKTAGTTFTSKKRAEPSQNAIPKIPK